MQTEGVESGRVLVSGTSGERIDLSIVSTLYNSSPYLTEFHRRVVAAAQELGWSYELILVNDGSPDDSLAVALRLQKTDPRIRIVDLSRNFGHHRAMMTGLGYSRAELVFLIDCDLEEEPELLLLFAERLRETGADVVFGVQERRKGRLFERLSGRLFYWLMSLLSAYSVVPNQLVARLMTGRYVRSLVRHRDREVYIAGLFAITGYEQQVVPVAKRHKGETVYSLRRKLALLVTSLTSFSNQPLVFVFYLGAMILVVSVVMIGVLIARKLFFGAVLAGWSSLMVMVAFFGGLMVFCIGIVGIYLSKVFAEVKDRPYTVVRAVHEADVSLS